VYPNPFNDYALVRFDLPDGSEVNFDLYNLAGAKVLSLSKKYTSGTNEFRIPRSNLTSGVYFLNVTTDIETKTIKLVVK